MRVPWVFTLAVICAAFTFVSLPADASASKSATPASAAEATDVEATPLADEASAAADLDLGKEANLEAMLRLALARNPTLLESDERVLAARERVGLASRLPDLEFKYEQWAVPLDRPLDLGSADTLMFGLVQTFPAHGRRGAASRMAAEDTVIRLADRNARAQELATQVRRAFSEDRGAAQESALHLEQLELAKHLVELTRASYRTGRGTQQDVLRLILEVARLHNDVAEIDQRRIASRALLNTLMARPTDAPLGPAPTLSYESLEPRIEGLLGKSESNRPELSAAEGEVRRGEASLQAARSEARWPSVMVGADYWYMPVAEERHAYGLMVSLNLPWLNGRHDAEVRAAEHDLAAERSANAAAKSAAAYQFAEAASRLDAARRVYDLLDGEVIPQATRNFEAARAAYSAGSSDAMALLDALRSVLQARLQHSRALVQVESSLADLERAAGTALPSTSARTERQP